MANEDFFVKDVDGEKPVVWNFGARKTGGRQIANEEGVAKTPTQQTHFLGCITKLFGCFSATQKAGDQLFEALSRCGIECGLIKAK